MILPPFFNLTVMKFLGNIILYGIVSFFTQHSSEMNAMECFCYDNEETNYSEWLVIKNDSSYVIGRKNTDCDDPLDIIAVMDFFREKSMVWKVERDTQEFSFSKLVSAPMYGLNIKYLYNCEYMDSQTLLVNIEIDSGSAIMQDDLGPKRRFYKRKEVVVVAKP